MIQRKQTLYLLLSFIFVCVCMFMPLGSFLPEGMGTGHVMYASHIAHDRNIDITVLPLFVLLLASGVMSAVSVFMYNNRKRQSAVCVWNMIALIVWYACFAFFVIDGKEPGLSFSPAFSSVLPFVALIAVFMARRGILYDEKLVRAADRIR